MNTTSRALRLAGLYLLGSTAIGTLFALPALGMAADWRKALISSLIQWWSWALVAVSIAAIDRRLPFSERQIGRRVAAHVPLSLLLTALYLYVAATLRAIAGAGPWATVVDINLLLNALKGAILWSWLVYWLILGAWLAREYYERYVAGELRMERIERLSTEARLHALRLQLDPHFLFNALNTISSEVEADPKLARRMIEHLGDLLRLTLETNTQTFVPLASELAFLDHYLAIQRIRFGGRLQFETRVDDGARLALVPAMTIQPLVENAIRHGISKRAAGGQVIVSASCVADTLRVLVEDDGAGLPPDWDLHTSNGLGLSVTRQRLDGLYPGRNNLFHVRRRAGGGTAVEINIPLAFHESPHETNHD